MVQTVFLLISILTFSMAAVVVFWVRRRELQKTALMPIPEANDPILAVPQDEELMTDHEEALVADQPEVEQPSESAVPDQEILAISVFAHPRCRFAGYELLQSLLSNNLRYGKYQIFHYFELDKPLFSLASATKPGTFDLDSMTDYATPGLTLFMTIDQDPHLEAIFEKMLQVTNQIAKDLDGYLVDVEHQPLNDSAIHAMRTRIRQHLREQEQESGYELK